MPLFGTLINPVLHILQIAFDLRAEIGLETSRSWRALAQLWMAVGPSQPQMLAATAMTSRCLRLRWSRGSESDSK